MAPKKKGNNAPKKGNEPQKVEKNAASEAKSVNEKSSSSKLLFCACVIGIFVSYLIYGLIQESFGSIRYKENENDPGKRFKFTTFTLFVQCLMNAFFSLVVILIIRYNKRNDPTSSIRTMSFSLTRDFATKFAILATTQSLAMLCSYKAIYYVSYPTQVIAKCCKPIPILVISLILGSSSYSKSRIISVVLITIGVSIFMYENALSSAKAGKSAAASSDNLLGWWIGIGFLCMSLASDGLTGHFQNRTKKENYKDMDKTISSWHMMFFSNIFSAVFFFIAMFVSGEAIPAVQFCIKFRTVIVLVLVSAVVSAIGQGFIYLTVTWYDPLVTSIVTTIRKFLSIVLSVFMYGHKISIIQWISTVIVFIGVLLGTVSDKMKKAKKD